ncbi:MAG: phospholipase [Muribaculaceae bacterium]|nr:phospholipase [Muribaculaceae bacterium]
MKGALIILAVTIITGIILYFFDRRKSDAQLNRECYPIPDTNDNSTPAAAETSDSQEKDSGECCGLHLVCEKELNAIADNKILYYDDEELDRFAGRTPEEYEAEEIEEFRDVMMTLLPQDVPGWARSLDRRHIQPPQEIRDELLIMLGELT